MQKEQIVNLIKPTLEKQTLFQFSQMKSFVDHALKEVVTKKFTNEEEKIKHLLDALYSIRDFAMALNNENSLRVSLIQQLQKIEKEIELGNVEKLQEEEESKNPVVRSEVNPKR
jgi:hypothetical protein